MPWRQGSKVSRNVCSCELNFFTDRRGSAARKGEQNFLEQPKQQRFLVTIVTKFFEMSLEAQTL